MSVHVIELPKGSAQTCFIILSLVHLYEFGSMASADMTFNRYTTIIPERRITEYQTKNFPSLLNEEYCLRSFLKGTVT
jgi:hypothetical protein